MIKECVIDIYRKYFWVIPLKDKKRYYNCSSKAFEKYLDEYKSEKRNPNKIWVDKGSDIYHRSMKSWLLENNI